MDYAKYQLDKYKAARASGPRDTVGVITETILAPALEPLQRYGAPTDRAQLLSSGVGEVQATLAIPYLYYVPRTSDAYSQGVQIIIAAIQKRLGIKATGFLDDATKARIELASGNRWFDKTWSAILGDAILYKPKALSGYVAIGEIPGAKVISIALVIGLGLYLLKKG